MKAIRCLVLLLIAGLCACKQPQSLVYSGIRDFGIRQAGTKQTMLAMTVRLYNPNRYTLKLKKADIEVTVNDRHLGKMTLQDKTVFYGHDTCSLPVLLNVDLKNILPGALQMVLSGGAANVKVTGTIKAGRHGIYVNIPVNYEEQQQLFSR